MPTLANAGLPMLAVYAPVLIFGFLPIVFLESLFFSRTIPVPYIKRLGRLIAANLISTMVGVPVTWFALVILQLLTGGGRAHGTGLLAVIWQAPWLIPYEEDYVWMIPLAAIVLTLPFWLISVVAETLILRRWPDTDGRLVLRACSLANGASYGFIIAYWLIMLMLGEFRVM